MKPAFLSATSPANEQSHMLRSRSDASMTGLPSRMSVVHAITRRRRTDAAFVDDVAVAYEAIAVRLVTGTDPRSRAGRRRYADPHPISVPTPVRSPNRHEGSSH